MKLHRSFLFGALLFAASFTAFKAFSADVFSCRIASITTGAAVNTNLSTTCSIPADSEILITCDQAMYSGQSTTSSSVTSTTWSKKISVDEAYPTDTRGGNVYLSLLAITATGNCHVTKVR